MTRVLIHAVSAAKIAESPSTAQSAWRPGIHAYVPTTVNSRVAGWIARAPVMQEAVSTAPMSARDRAYRSAGRGRTARVTAVTQGRMRPDSQSAFRWGLPLHRSLELCDALSPGLLSEIDSFFCVGTDGCYRRLPR